MTYTDVLEDDDNDPGIHIGQLGAAIAAWSWMQDGETPQTVAAAAATFNTTIEIVRRAVEEHPWTFLCGPSDNRAAQTIEHDGE